MPNLQHIKILIENKQNRSALGKLKKLVTKNKHNFEAQRLIGVIYLQQNNARLAEKHLKLSLQAKPSHEPTLLNLASLYKSQRKYPEAHRCIQQILDQSPANPSVLYNLANLYRDQDKLSQAESAYLNCLQLQKNHIGALVALGFLTKNLGRIDEAIEYFHQALAMDPYQHEIYWALANLKQYRFTDSEQAVIDQMISQAGDKAPTELLFTKAYILEHGEHYEAAFEQLQQANQRRYRQLNRKPFDWSTLTQNIKQTFSPEFMTANSASTQSSVKQPIFIVSMPRSGSTLTEQILASHSDVYGAAELPYFPKIITNLGQEKNNSYPESLKTLDSDDFAKIGIKYLDCVGTKFNQPMFTDKQPLNFNFVGAILMALPNAKIIHCTRLDLAVLLSCYKQLFAHGHEYSYDIQELVANYQHQHNIMNYWKKRFPDKIHTLSYKNIVENTQSEIERLLGFLALDWQDDCLRFYNTKRRIKTASAGQVTQKIYDSSMQLHTKYQKSMAKFIDLLKIH